MQRMTRFSVLFIALLMSAGSVFGQGVVTLDWGGSTTTTGGYDTHTAPYSHWYAQGRHQYLLTPQDFINVGLTPSGPVTFNSLAFYVTGFNGSSRELNEFTIKMRNTTLSTLNGFEQNGLQQVYGPVDQIRSQLPVPGWITHSFDNPFIWDGVSNILIDVCFQNPNYQYSRTWAVRYGTPSGVPTRQRYRYYDHTYGVMCTYVSSLSGGTRVPNMQLGCGGSSSITDFSMPSLYYVPNIIPVDYTIGHPTESFTGSIVFNLYTPGGQLVASETLDNIAITGGSVVTGTYNFNAMNVAPGWYVMELDFKVLNSCKFEDHVFMKEAALLLAPGTTACEVWPGDVNDDGIVNYGDRASLNKYIFDANLSPVWLNGPSRYRVDQDTNPLTYLTWEMQPGVPWGTNDGCYKDADGNGMVNNFDYIPIKMNWGKTHGYIAPKSDNGFTPNTFDMSQNYPNPFNPSTTIKYQMPEAGAVRLLVTDMLGREVATLVDGTVEAGTHTVNFDASSLTTGSYIATISMIGSETGMTFSKTIKMTLNK